METEQFSAWSMNAKYILSNKGNIESKYQYSGRYMIQSVGNRDYLQVMLKENDYCPGKWFKVHRLIAEAFVPKENIYQTDVVFLDHDLCNLEASNLKWLTHTEALHHYKTYISGEDHWSYGKKASDKTKALLSKSKTGENHPKFKGYYIVKGKKYTSVKAASEGSGIPPGILMRRCKSPNNIGFGFETI